MLLQTDPIEYVEDICENMQLFPKEDFLTGDQLMFEFKPEVVAINAALILMYYRFWKIGCTFVWKYMNFYLFFSLRWSLLH